MPVVVFVNLSRFSLAAHSCLYKLYAFCDILTRKQFFSHIVCGFLLLFSNNQLWILLVFVVKYKFVSRNATSANTGACGRGDGGVRGADDRAKNALSGDAIGLMCREEAEDIDLILRWTLLEYRQERRDMMDVGHFSAMAVDGKSL